MLYLKIMLKEENIEIILTYDIKFKRAITISEILSVITSTPITAILNKFVVKAIIILQHH